LFINAKDVTKVLTVLNNFSGSLFLQKNTAGKEKHYDTS